MKPTSTIFRFSSLPIALEFAETAASPMGVLLGDDGRFWVVTAKDFSRYLKAGYAPAVYEEG